MPYETGFVYTSEISTWWNGFVFGADLSRIYTSLFFQAGYLLGEVTGFAGSYVPFQIVYAALWWARGLLVFLVVRRVLPAYDAFAFLAGAMVLVHSSDGATEWVGQMPQWSYMFWMLAAVYLLIRGIEETGARRIVFLALAILCEHFTLWTYESPIVIILLAPILLLRFQPSARRAWRALAAWYGLASVYLGVLAFRYAHSSGQTYQQAVMRRDWNVGALLNDWLFNVYQSLAFWGWSREMSRSEPAGSVLVLAALAAAVVIGGVSVLGVKRIPEARKLFGAACVGSLLLVCSFPAYLVLESARSLWRTQILSGLGAGVVLASAIAVASRAAGGWARVAVVAILSGCVAWFGSHSALKKSAHHRAVWELYRHAMTEVLQVAPRIRPGTLIVLKNVPREQDPFAGDNLWFDMAVRLAYPGVPVDGVYLYDDGSMPGGPKPQIESPSRWIMSGGSLVHEGGIGSIFCIRYSQSEQPAVLDHLPAPWAETSGQYEPTSRIAPGPPPQRVIRRFRLNERQDSMVVRQTPE